MTSPEFELRRFEPVALHLHNIGPYRQRVFTYDLCNAEREPCNLFFFLANNGWGKTTAMEAIASLMTLLEQPPDLLSQRSDFQPPAGFGPTSAMQLDVRLTIGRGDGRVEVAILTLLATGRQGLMLKAWPREELARHGATDWCLLSNGSALQNLENGHGINHSIRDGLFAEMDAARGPGPEAFEDNPERAPALLYFPVNRDLVPTTKGERTITRPRSWEYRPVRRFGPQGDRWSDSLDNLLAWLTWLGEGRFKEVQQVIDQRVFLTDPEKRLLRVRKDPPEAVIRSHGEEHRLELLSSGEKSVLQLVVQLGVYATRNTLVLIDELDLHLHPQGQKRLLEQLKELVKQYDRKGRCLTLLATTHSPELIRFFGYEIPEEGLRKGGHLMQPAELW